MNITIYSKPSCSQCDQAKMLLKMKGIDFNFKMLDVDFTLNDLKNLAPTAKTFPVIFKEDVYLGGLKELKEIV